MLDFEEIKQIRIVEVLSRYGVQLTCRGEWASAPCPLPTHKQGDKGRNFTVNLQQNYWRCFSETCNNSNGGKKGGDVINLVAVLEKCRIKEAAEKLASWYKKPVPHIEERVVREATKTPLPVTSEHKSVSDSVKGGYMQNVSAWFDSFIVRRPDETEEAYLKRVKKGVLNTVYESYQNGRKLHP